MTAYNAERFVAEAITSIINQTFADWEFVIIDDASTDKTWGIIQSFIVQDERIRVLRNDVNQGIFPNRNHLVNEARGKYIVWQDTDDVSLPHRLALQYSYMESHPPVGIAGGSLEVFDENGIKGIRRYPLTDNEIRKKIFRYAPCAEPAVIIRKECLLAMGGYGTISPVAEDLALAFRLGQKYEFGNLPDILIKYREHSANSTHMHLRLMELYTIFLRYRFHNDGYQMTWSDKIYNFCQYSLIFIVPAKWKIALFNRMRNN